MDGHDIKKCDLKELVHTSYRINATTVCLNMLQHEEDGRCGECFNHVAS